MTPIRPENRSRYPDDWQAISRAIRSRAGGRCECKGECGRGHDSRCHATGGMVLPHGSVVVLTVAHLDHTPENNDPTNLRAMCQACHLAYDRDHHAATRAATRRAAIQASGQLTLGETDA